MERKSKRCARVVIGDDRRGACGAGVSMVTEPGADRVPSAGSPSGVVDATGISGRLARTGSNLRSRANRSHSLLVAVLYRYRPLRGLKLFIGWLDPGAYAPGFMLTRAPRADPVAHASHPHPLPTGKGIHRKGEFPSKGKRDRFLTRVITYLAHQLFVQLHATVPITFSLLSLPSPFGRGLGEGLTLEAFSYL